VIRNPKNTQKKKAQQSAKKVSGQKKPVEFVGSIAQSATEGQTVRLPPALMQPIVSDDVAAALADIAVDEPLNGTVELAGPEPIRLDELVRRFLSANRDARQVTTDVRAGYFGSRKRSKPHPRR